MTIEGTNCRYSMVIESLVQRGRMKVTNFCTRVFTVSWLSATIGSDVRTTEVSTDKRCQTFWQYPRYNATIFIA